MCSLEGCEKLCYNFYLRKLFNITLIYHACIFFPLPPLYSSYPPFSGLTKETSDLLSGVQMSASIDFIPPKKTFSEVRGNFMRKLVREFGVDALDRASVSHGGIHNSGRCYKCY